MLALLKLIWNVIKRLFLEIDAHALEGLLFLFELSKQIRKLRRHVVEHFVGESLVAAAVVVAVHHPLQPFGKLHALDFIDLLESVNRL